MARCQGNDSSSAAPSWGRIVGVTLAVLALSPLPFLFPAPQKLAAGALLFLAGGLILRPPGRSRALGLPPGLRAAAADLAVPAVAWAAFAALARQPFWTVEQTVPAWLDLVAVVLPEEVMFRYGLQGALQRRGMPHWAALLVATTAFAVPHLWAGGGALYGVQIFVGGLGFGLLYGWRGRLLPPVLLHLVVNQYY